MSFALKSDKCSKCGNMMLSLADDDDSSICSDCAVKEENKK